MKKQLTSVCAGVLVSLFATAAIAGNAKFSDPKGDDKGPGSYTYPTDAVYKKGSFDLREFNAKLNGDEVEFSASVDSKLEDPWGMGSGFAVQMIYVFIDTDGNAANGHKEGMPGLNIGFADGNGWDKVVILSPQKQARVNSEVAIKAADLKADIVVPGKTVGKGQKISGSVKLADLGGGDPEKWRYQVVVQSNEGFPAKTDLLSRKVNEFEGQHRFGGGNDGDCDPQVIDILAGKGEGDKSEVAAQQEMLAYECNDDGSSKKLALLKLISK